MVNCIRCGFTFIPGLKNAWVCGNCWRLVGTERHKAGLSRIPKQDRQQMRIRIKRKGQMMEDYKEEMKDENAGKEFKWKMKKGQLEQR